MFIKCGIAPYFIKTKGRKIIMKKIMSLLLTLCIIVSPVSSAYALPYYMKRVETTDSLHHSVKVSIRSTILDYDGTEYDMGTAPYIDEETNSSMVPLRYVITALYNRPNESDHSKYIIWNNEDKSVSVYINNNVLTFSASDSAVYLNSVQITKPNEYKIEIKDGRMFVYYRLLAKLTDTNPSFDSESLSIYFSW